MDINQIQRRRLRQSISIIPQETCIFQGTVGYNLDPTGLIPRKDLEKTLAACQTLPLLGSQLERAMTLDTAVQPLGANLSHSQRQIFSWCRALVRHSRIMLLDEATASMDAETDQAIQQVLRKKSVDESQGKVTLVTIAHRLETIMDYDKVVVMGGGRVLE